MDGFDAPGFMRTLRHRQGVFMDPSQVLSGRRLLHIRAGELILQPQVNADLRITQRDSSIFNLTLEVDVPASAGVLRKVPCFHAALPWSRLPETDASTLIGDLRSAEADTAALERYPAQRPLTAAPLEFDLACCLFASGVLLADFAQRIAATRGRKVDCLARLRDQTWCSISSILRRCAAAP